MEPKKKYKIVVLFVVFLVVVCLAEGFIIYKQYAKDSAKDSDNTFETFSSSLRDKFKKDQKERRDEFDRFFDDDFFSKQTDPFAEMERMQKQLDKMMGRQSRGIFNDSWDSWFGDRFFGGSDDVEFNQKENKDAYIITLRIPNLKKNKLDIKIEKDGISISGDFSQIAEKKDADGKIISKREVHRTISKKFPIPSDADHQKAEVKNKKDKIIITLPKNGS